MKFVRRPDFSSLSVKDLLEARNAFHFHLANQEHVEGTAIGRYLIRHKDSNFNDPDKATPSAELPPRTLANSGVTKWSWPCVLVFVSEWSPRGDFAKNPSQFIPPRLYLPDGRVVPTCVVHAPRSRDAAAPITNLTFPAGLHGGGYPILTDDQQQERIGSAGCLVTDGYYTYVLTSSHVVGDPGTPAYTVQRGQRKRVGLAHRRSENKVEFSEVYPGFASIRTYMNIDAGLFRVDNINEWTAQVYGIGRIGELIDINVDTINLDLIGRKVKAFGAASGALSGEISALFFRYQSVGGFDYVADLLVGPRAGEDALATRPGDSGTIWFWDREAEVAEQGHKQPASHQTGAESKAAPAPPNAAPELLPIAMQWGGQRFSVSDTSDGLQFALATNLSNVCRLLDVEIIRDWADDHSLYWGKVGHYKIAISACFLLSNPNVAELFAKNAVNIGVSDANLKSGQLPKVGEPFIPLADVPDLVWRSKRQKDAANHFADMDQPGPNEKTLLDLWFDTPSSRTPAKWTAFYDALEQANGEDLPDRHRGALPFRVRQLYEAMVGFVKQGDVPSYICAAGVLAHYVGDACQPLHVSMLHHGDPDNPDDDKVHGRYETDMLDARRVEIVQLVNDNLAGVTVQSHVTGGAKAAHRSVVLMRDTIGLIAPAEVVEVFNETNGQSAKMWDALGERTGQTMAAGALCLAELWESAWIEGKGDIKVDPQDIKKVSKATLKNLYLDKLFVESDWLRNMSF